MKFQTACGLCGDGTDCNNNGVLDSCDIASGSSLDCNNNGVPDECESPLGACCVGDTCTVVRQTCCDSQGGAFAGLGTTCEAGACCVGGACMVMAQGCCSSQGGGFIGEGVTCDDCNGNGDPDACETEDLHPCCVPPGGPCILWTAECCSSVGGALVTGRRGCTLWACDFMPY
ncbi:MAG: hypothetical protein V1790_18155 [Planctomycetota bacterium]